MTNDESQQTEHPKWTVSTDAGPVYFDHIVIDGEGITFKEPFDPHYYDRAKPKRSSRR